MLRSHTAGGSLSKSPVSHMSLSSRPRARALHSQHQSDPKDLQWRMGICWRIRAAAGPICPRRVSTSCPQGTPPTLSGGAAGSRDGLEERPPPRGPVTEKPLPTTNNIRCCANGAGSSGATPKSQTTLNLSELSSSCQPQQQRSMRFQTPAFKCRQAIPKRRGRYRSK